MKIQKVVISNLVNFTFKAGKTNLYSDFDGTYMPKKYNHDAVCNKLPEVNKEEFQAHFQKLYDLFKKIKGDSKESKLNFVLTTGRNIHEQNYYLDKIKKQGLRVPLPNSLITCNGQDEFYLDIENEEEFYNNPQKQAFSKDNVNTKKREEYRNAGWDYEKIKTTLKNLLQEKQFFMEREFINGHNDVLANHIKRFLSIDEVSYKDLTKELQKPSITEEEVRAILERYSKTVVSSEKEANDYEWNMGKLGYLVWQELNSKITIIDNIPTTRSKKEYDNNLSLEQQMQNRSLNKDNEIYAFSDDGELGIRVAVNPKFKNNITNRNFGNNNNLRLLDHLGLSCYEISKLKKGSYLEKEFEVRPLGIDKYRDTKALVDKIINEKSNDLVIVAGDGSNDFKMLNISQYINNDSNPRMLTSTKLVEKLKTIPLVTIYIDNRTPEEKNKIDSKESILVKNGEYYNYDGNIRFIHVDPSDPKKPHTLEEATQLAIYSYAQQNEEFKKNLSLEMQELVANYKMTYPIDEKISKEAQRIYSQDYLDSYNFIEKFLCIKKEYEKLAKLEEKFGVENIELEACKDDSELSIRDKLKILSSLLLIVVNKKEMTDSFSIEKIQELYSKNITEKETNSIKKALSCLKDEIKYLTETDIRNIKTKLTDKLNEPEIPTDPPTGQQNPGPQRPGTTDTDISIERPFIEKIKNYFNKTVKWLKQHKLVVALTILITASIAVITIKNKKNEIKDLKIVK